MEKSSQTAVRSNRSNARLTSANSIGLFGSIKTWLTLGVFVGLAATAVGCSSQQAQRPAAQSPVAQQSDDAEAPDAQAASPEAGAKDSFRTLDNVQLTPGPDPMAMVLATRQLSAEAKGTEQIRLSYPAPDKAVVVVTKTGLADDSVAAMRIRYEFTGAGEAGGTQWQLAKATEQNKCRANRGPQDWSGELCK